MQCECFILSKKSSCSALLGTEGVLTMIVLQVTTFFFIEHLNSYWIFPGGFQTPFLKLTLWKIQFVGF